MSQGTYFEKLCCLAPAVFIVKNLKSFGEKKGREKSSGTEQERAKYLWYYFLEMPAPERISRLQQQVTTDRLLKILLSL